MMGSVGAVYLLLWAGAVLIGLGAFILWVWSLVDCLTRRDDSFAPVFGSVNPKIVWALIIFFTHIFGTIIYLLVAGTKNKPKNSPPPIRTAETEESQRILELIANGKITAAEGQRLLAALEIRGQETASAQQRTSGSKALKIGCGCLLLLIIPILLLVFIIVLPVRSTRITKKNNSSEQSRMEQELQLRMQRNVQPAILRMNPATLGVTNIAPAAGNP